ncbi:MAG: ATP-binding cassette domain-containing protein [Oscillospiraceae bacterium]|nr:ATP-binding cassette domain-containing protein [Oscillospiraceae bacterium]
MDINLINICKSYDENVVIDNLSCMIPHGAVTCIMGASGSGKTTLIHILAGIEKADSGNISGIDGLKKSIVFQDDRLCEGLSAVGNIRLVADKSFKTSDIYDELSALGFQKESARQLVSNMSGGERRRVALLRALMANYDILFLDEPFKGLDSETKELVMLYTKERVKGKTVLLVTHDEMEWETMGENLIVM